MRAEKQAIIQKQRKRRTTLRSGTHRRRLAAAIILIVVLIQISGDQEEGRHIDTTTTTRSPTSTTTTSTFPPPSTLPLTSVAVAPTCAPKGTTKRVVLFTKAPPDCIGADVGVGRHLQDITRQLHVQMDAATSYAAVNNFVFLAQWNYLQRDVLPPDHPRLRRPGRRPGRHGHWHPGRLDADQCRFPGYSFTGNVPPETVHDEEVTAAATSQATSSCANSNWSLAPTAASSSWCCPAAGTLNGEPNYTIFGAVISGMSVVETIGSRIPSSGSTGTPKVKVYLLKVTLKEVKA